MKRRLVFIIGIILVLVPALVFGCGTKTTTTTATTTTPVEPSYAGALTESVVTAINQDNYAKFSQDFDQAMKDGLPEAAFQGLRSQLQNSVGDYVSKQFQTIVVQGDITTVIYAAKYTKADKVTITISFRTVDGQNQVAGLYFK